jgi:hypothetical protein
MASPTAFPSFDAGGDATDVVDRSALGLAPTERVLWVGRPAARLFWPEFLLTTLISLLPLSFGAVATWLQANGPMSPIFWILGPGMMCIGFAMLFSQRGFARRLRESRYVITDRRALVWRPVAWAKGTPCTTPNSDQYSFDGNAINACQSKRRLAGRTDLVLGREVVLSRRRGPYYIEIGFLGLASPEVAHDELRRLGKSLAASPGPLAVNSLNGDGSLQRDTIIGESPDMAPRSFLGGVLGAASIAKFALLLLPWLLIAIGCIAVGVLGLARGDRTLIICLPAGLFLAALFVIVPWLMRRFYRPIQRFECTAEKLTYWYDCTAQGTRKSFDDLKAIRKQQTRHSLWGYVILFRDGTRIFVNRAMPNADAMYLRLEDAITQRKRLK